MADNAPIRPTTSKDIPIVYEFLQRQNKEAYMIRSERAWKVMAAMLCEDGDAQLSTVYQIDGVVVGFCSIITDPGKFWKTFVKRYGYFRFWMKKFRQTIEILQEQNNGKTKPVIEGPIDAEFLARSQKRYESVPGKTYGYYLYVDPEMKAGKGGIAFELNHDMESRLKRLGFKTIESEILIENEIARQFNLVLGRDIRSIGDMWYMVASLSD